MLALATHEPHFCILREVVLDRKQKEKQQEQIALGNLPGPPKMQFLQVWVMREYLQLEFSTGCDWSKVPGGFDLERVIDDFVFLCFFVGNDFLPHIPALEIRDGAIDMLLCAYKALLPRLGGYLSDGGRVHLPRAEMVLREVAAYEEEIFERRRRREEGRERAMAARAVAEGGVAAPGAFGSSTRRATRAEAVLRADEGARRAAVRQGGLPQLPGGLAVGLPQGERPLYVTLLNLSEAHGPNKELTIRRGGRPAAPGGAQAAPRNFARDGGGGEAAAHAGVGLLSGGGDDAPTGDADADGGFVDDFDERLNLRLQAKEEAAAAVPDEVRFGESGWKERYYSVKLHAPRSDEAFRRYVVRCYVEGLCWVLMYYYQGVQDWGWFYPFHYAPCASDLVGLADFAGGQFELGAPFLPFQQLMAVFPPASGHALPEAYRTLMVHPSSPIIDFYPIDFCNDLNGKKYSWQAIALLPFIDAQRLRTALAPLDATLTEEEAERNTHGSELLFTSARSPLGRHCAGTCTSPRRRRSRSCPPPPRRARSAAPSSTRAVASSASARTRRCRRRRAAPTTASAPSRAATSSAVRTRRRRTPTTRRACCRGRSSRR